MSFVLANIIGILVMDTDEPIEADVQSLELKVLNVTKIIRSSSVMGQEKSIIILSVSITQLCSLNSYKHILWIGTILC